jgi:transcriptional regulator with XRE-family HTH domain
MIHVVPRTNYPSFAVPSLWGYRQLKDWSQAELARRAKLTPQTVMRLEAGTHKAQRATVRKLARALGVTPADLMAEPEAEDQ